MERALGESDLFFDYSSLRATGDVGDRDLAGESVRQMQTYNDRRWSQGRPLLDLRTHSSLPDVFVASYGQKRNASTDDPDGCALVRTQNCRAWLHRPVQCASAVMNYRSGMSQ